MSVSTSYGYTSVEKKTGLEANNVKNISPVSNLSFLSKILEKTVLDQLQTHLSASNLLEIWQSAYRKNHSIETAVLSVLDNLLNKADEKHVSVLALLDLSAAFDTLDHAILLKRLELTFEMYVTVLDWFASYLCSRE